MTHIPSRTPLAWYHYSWESTITKTPKRPQKFPQQLDISPPFQNTKLALAVARQIKITCQDATLVLMTYVSMETWDDRLLEVRGWILRESCDLGEMEECRNWRGREERGLFSQKGSCSKENPLHEREIERERECLLSFRLCPPLSLTRKHKHELCNWAKVIMSLSQQGFSAGHFQLCTIHSRCHSLLASVVQQVLHFLCSWKYMTFNLEEMKPTITLIYQQSNQELKSCSPFFLKSKIYGRRHYDCVQRSFCNFCDHQR